ncbi:hypothetical protein, unknown function [Leishmania tarentolae]|uniref:DUF1736 domain-containing protein n=1 Tax=Leishmania tarentolae TaxID=5689 RepID=A0A640KFJ7_LEITA|nr:hypothetical protein, unknown function [Leishmania tarentolae]
MTMKKNPAKRPLVAETTPWRLVCSFDVYLHALLLLIAATIFSNGVRGKMVFDDDSAIIENADSYADKTSLASIFYNDFWGIQIDRLDSNKSYRPIIVLTFRIQHWLMGYHHSPAFLRSFNYIIAYFNTCLLFYLARLYVYIAAPSAKLFATNATTQSFTDVLASPAHAVPFVAAVLFLVHPVHVDAVTSIVGRCELLYCFFGLIGFFCIHRYLNHAYETTRGKSVGAVPSANGLKTSLECGKPTQKRLFTERYLVFSVGAVVVSVLCKDSAITLTAVYGVHACVMYACGRCQKRHSLLVIVLSTVELLGYFTFRREFVGNLDLRNSPRISLSEQPQLFVPKGLFHWISIRWLILVTNLKLLFFPTALCNEYSYNCIPHVYNMQDPRVPSLLAITGAAVVTVLGLLIGTFVYRSRVALAGLIAFLWMSIAYTPVSHLFVTIGTFIAERCLYVSSIGSVLLITFIVASPGLHHGAVPRYFYLLLILCAGWGVFSHRRNDDWQSNEHLSRAAIRTCPNSGKAHFQLAAAVAARENFVTPEVVALIRRSLELDPSSSKGYYYLALYELQSNDTRKAYEYLRKCMSDLSSYAECGHVYEKVRSVLYPEMTESERYVDLATTTSRDSFKASYFRMAGMIALQQEAKPCLAKSLLHRALTRWNKAHVYWVSDDIRREPGLLTHCNTLYWYEQSVLQCEKQLMTRDAKSARVEETEGDDDYAPLGSSPPSRKLAPRTPQDAVDQATIAAEHFRHCGTDWHNFLSGPAYNYNTIPNRMEEYLTVAHSTWSLVTHFTHYTAVNTPERHTLLLTSLDIMLRLYCHCSALTRDDYVKKKVDRLFHDHMQEFAQKWAVARTPLVSDIKKTVHTLRVAPSLSVAEKEWLGRLLATSPCASELSLFAL